MKKFVHIGLLYILTYGIGYTQSGDNANVKALLDTARSQNLVTEFGTKLALNGSHEAVATLIKTIDIAEGDERATLARSLQALNSARASAELQNLMIQNSDDAVVAVQARDALARVATGSDVIRLSQAITSDPEQGLARSYILGTLARVRNTEAIPQLTELAAYSSDPAIFTAAAIALGGIGSREAVASLIDTIEQQQITDMNDPAVQALLSVRDKDAKITLKNAYFNTKNSVVKYAVEQALLGIDHVN